MDKDVETELDQSPEFDTEVDEICNWADSQYDNTYTFNMLKASIDDFYNEKSKESDQDKLLDTDENTRIGEEFNNLK